MSPGSAHLLLMYPSMKRIALSLLLALVACGGADPSADDGAATSEDVAPLLAGEQLSPTHIAQLLRDAGFPHAVIPKMVCTAKYESSFFTRATNTNRNGSVDYGLFQINDRIWLHACGVTRAELMDPATNAACAKQVYDSGGLNSWYGYQKHRGTCNAYQVR